MTRIEFEQLNIKEQIKAISQYGDFVADRVESGNRYYLYAISSFYVELLHELSNPNTNGLVINRLLNVAEAFDTSLADLTNTSA
ncbi:MULTISPECIES: hypothetical protein [Niastella]|uniref:Uncharacterized protein n=1 Tax=Niastella soli TaxID=2821487 RepID=A0ABS3Z3E8_9BACT|nr:hypothetical protein [Niastella soli]MBO9204697.1 hypothetical protein [Niastella soli]